jgi:hypothetical protein
MFHFIGDCITGRTIGKPSKIPSGSASTFRSAGRGGRAAYARKCWTELNILGLPVRFFEEKQSQI